jgi:hypothetical protein
MYAVLLSCASSHMDDDGVDGSSRRSMCTVRIWKVPIWNCDGLKRAGSRSLASFAHWIVRHKTRLSKIHHRWALSMLMNSAGIGRRDPRAAQASKLFNSIEKCKLSRRKDLSLSKSCREPQCRCRVGTMTILHVQIEWTPPSP